MSPEPAPHIARLNAHTIPMIAEERRVLATLPHRLVEVEGATDDEALAACRDADAIMIISAYLRASVICELTRCRIISRLGTGVGKIAVAEATRKGIIRYAALDVFGVVNVFDAKGFPTDHPLFTLDNVLLSPHVAAASQEGAVDSRRRGAQAVVDVLSGKWPEHPVDPDVKPWFSLAR